MSNQITKWGYTVDYIFIKGSGRKKITKTFLAEYWVQLLSKFFVLLGFLVCFYENNEAAGVFS